MSFKRNLHQDITHWPVSGSDGFGGFTFSAPILLKGRWEEKQELFLDVNSEEAVSQAIVYLGDDIDVGDWLGLGDNATIPVANPTSIDDTYRIRQRNKTTDLRNVMSLRKAFL